MSKDPMANRPRLPDRGAYVSDKMAGASIQLLGGTRIDSVAITRSQLSRLAKMYGYDLKKETHPVAQSGVERNVCRHAKMDGLRIIAFMSKYCSFGEDPLKVIKLAMVDAGYDVELDDSDLEEDYDWDDEDNEE